MRTLLARFQRDLRLYRNILADRRTSWMARILLGAAVAYALSPIDLIPDFIPVVGHLDDVIIVPLLIYLALRTIPQGLIEEHRRSLAAPQSLQSGGAGRD